MTNLPWLAPFVTVGVALAGWASGLTRKVYVDAGRISVLEERTSNTDDQLAKMDTKLDKIVEHLLGKGE